ncbi:MAG: putative sulfate exporter family transporter [Acidobacteria bacterium]|nr:putative sulfate exporter family transporter [Acidobacteriota bacterium]MBE3130634.1 putative sulfate exporter family transporter [Acidobacteriota bacterium]
MTLSFPNKEHIPGWLLMVAVGVLAMLLSNLVVAGGKHPLEATALAVIIGLLARNIGVVPGFFHAGIKQFDKPLIWGVIFIGATLNFKDIGAQGPQVLAIILVTMTVSYFVIYALGRLFNLSPALSTLLSVGTTICGGSAIAITAPLIKAKEEEMCYAIGTITLWGLAAILFYPQIAKALGVGDIAFGVFAGTAIHATPQVVGAGFIFSDLAGKTATAVKLVRNCFMAPLAFMIAAGFARTHFQAAALKKEKVNWAKAFPWFLFGYFVMAGLNTAGYFSAKVVGGLTWLGRFLIVVSMAGIGLNTAFGAFRKVGLKPLVVGFLGALAVAACSILMISLLL